MGAGRSRSSAPPAPSDAEAEDGRSKVEKLRAAERVLRGAMSKNPLEQSDAMHYFRAIIPTMLLVAIMSFFTHELGLALLTSMSVPWPVFALVISRRINLPLAYAAMSVMGAIAVAYAVALLYWLIAGLNREWPTYLLLALPLGATALLAVGIIINTDNILHCWLGYHRAMFTFKRELL